ncbi:MAG: hypothetical protein OQJ89_05655 [Kangiellaceae bacterium]|nr:hypothetical protein [Kangiellaceae bacterium]
MNDKVKNLLELIADDWGESSPQYSACSDIIDYISSNNYEQVAHMTLGSISKVISIEIEMKLLLECLQYLSGSRIKVLKVSFELIDDEDNCFALSSSDVKEATKTGKLAHPEFGCLIPEPSKHIFPVYSPRLESVN